jgi:tRNA A37 threonylcarbamoyladenosine biosynthesis protein TsaE
VDVAVTSPTFTLVQEHDTRPAVAHADLYRLGNAAEVAELGLRAARDDGRLVLVEWGKPYTTLLGGDALLLELSLGPRRAELTATGPRSREILVRLSETADDARDHVK